jgi:hypothetical protein
MPDTLDRERLSRALVAIATKDEPLLENEIIVAVAIEPAPPDEMAEQIAAAYDAEWPEQRRLVEEPHDA